MKRDAKSVPFLINYRFHTLVSGMPIVTLAFMVLTFAAALCLATIFAVTAILRLMLTLTASFIVLVFSGGAVAAGLTVASIFAYRTM